MLSLIFTIVNVKTLNKLILIIKTTWQSLRSSAKSYFAAAAAASIIESAETDSFEI